MARLIRIPLVERPVFAILLAQGGEFGFVVFQTALGARLIEAEVSSLLVASVAISMLLTPLLLLLADRLLVPRLAGQGQRDEPSEISEQQEAPVIIAGFGRYGQIVGRLLGANGLKATLLDSSADAVEGLRRFGWKTFYGDASRLDLLRVAGAAEARVFVLAIDDVDKSVEVAELVREHFPHLTVVARARNVSHYYALQKAGVTLIERETLDSALMSARSVLELMGFTPHEARNQAQRFRRHSIELLAEMAPHFGDQNKLEAVVKQGRAQLEETWARERAEQQTQLAHSRGSWAGQGPLVSPAPPSPP